jgi:hypothetical protein
MEAIGKPASHRTVRKRQLRAKRTTTTVIFSNNDGQLSCLPRDDPRGGRRQPNIPLPYIDLLNVHYRPLQYVPHRKFLRKFRRRYRVALQELWAAASPLDVAALKRNCSIVTKDSKRTTIVKEVQNLSGDNNDFQENHYALASASRHVITSSSIPTRTIDDQSKEDNDPDKSSDNLPQQTPPPTIMRLLEHETTLCDSPKDRGVVNDMSSSMERLPFGYFSCGQQLYRNKLNDQESLKDGFVALHQLVLPHCKSALMTTFDSHATMKASIHLACEVCFDVPKVLLVGHADYLGMSYCGLCLPPSVRKLSPKVHHEWYWMACRPFGRSELLMHAKILLFRSNDGLRIVVSGNNLTEKQWTEDRDCMWIHDVPASVVAPRQHRPTLGGDETPMIRLRCFLVDLLKSSAAFYDIDNHMDEIILSFIYARVGHILDGLEDNNVNCLNIRFVYSFPRMMHRGGWQQLCKGVWELRRLEYTRQEALCSNHHSKEEDLWYDTDDGDGNDEEYGAKTMKRMMLFAMSGSFGDLTPNFLLQMRMAMSGCRAAVKDNSCDLQQIDARKETLLSIKKSTPWSAIANTFCLWPSKETILTMNPIAVLGRCRPMSRKHWDTIPESARNRIFFDAIPNPNGPSLQSSSESQVAAGFGRNLAPNYLGLRLRGGPLSAYHAFTHGKAIFAITMANAGKKGKLLRPSKTDTSCHNPPYAAVYVGSHNFSKKAWGSRESRPGNIEFGVVLLTTDQEVAGQWRSRLPYELPDPNSISHRDYRPGRSFDIFQRVEQYFHPLNLDDMSSGGTI